MVSKCVTISKNLIEMKYLEYEEEERTRYTFYSYTASREFQPLSVKLRIIRKEQKKAKPLIHHDLWVTRWVPVEMEIAEVAKQPLATTAEKDPEAFLDYVLEYLNKLRSDEEASWYGLILFIPSFDSLSSRPEVEEVRESLIAIRELLQEAFTQYLLGRTNEAWEAVDKAAELALMTRELLRLKGEGIKLVRKSDLVKIGEIGGRPIYALKRNSSDKQEA